VTDSLRSLGLHLRTARHVLRRHPLSVRALAEPLDERMIFVVGCPRSGTTFLAGSLGACPGFVDMGEVAAFKAAIPELAALDPVEAGPRIRRVLTIAGRLGLVGGLRAVEQTPEAAALTLHIVRDGRDVACSLLERGWLSAGRAGADDAGQAYGRHARFWVEPERREEFEHASDVRRAAWAWRRYVGAARGSIVWPVRYERLTTAPDAVAAELAHRLEMEPAPLAAALAEAHGDSVGRFRRDLTAAQVAEVEAEAGELLAELGYS
jgi:hypothetical protein